jgi:flagellar hook-length control protein FliK
VTAPAPTAPTAAAPANPKPAEPVAAPAAPDAPAPTAPVTAPGAHTAPRAVAAPNPVPVAHAPAALVDLVHVAQERGASQARMVLHPDSLGGVEVHLRQTAEGIRATVHVHHPEALQTLQAGLGDLRRGLEDRGVTIDQLDLGLAPGNQDPQQQGNGAARGDGGFSARTGATGLSGRDDGADDDEILTTPNATSTRASAGILVDVMA